MTKLSSLDGWSKSSTFVDVLRERSAAEQSGYCFLQDGETQAVDLTYSELDQRARSIAASLQRLKAQGERALLLYPSGLEYIAAFFGCLYAGVIAVPAYPPRRNQKLSRIVAIAADAQARFVLTTKALLSEQQHDLSSLATVEHWIPTDRLNSQLAADWQPPAISPETLAFLQYTSGSTGQPKGVKVSHANLLHNSALIHQAFEHSSTSQGVIWLPPYHDMGLIGGILQPLYGGFSVTLMSPVAFLQKPIRWLQAISNYRGTTSGAPNFAYELCLQKTTPEQRANLDLSSWDLAFIGAEPVRADTLTQFATAFACSGFHPKAFYPCYGLAEATLFVSGIAKSNPPKTLTVSSTAVQQNQITFSSAVTQTFVSCGQPAEQIVIVDPATERPCEPNQIGEIWLSGQSVAQGYWNQPDAAFQAKLADRAELFFRTGDLGFVNQNELYLTGRIKDVIIIRGRNYYPQDIEQTVEQSYLGLTNGAGAAFSVEIEQAEQLVVVQEVSRECWRSVNIEEATQAIRAAISNQHQLQAHAIVLVKPGSIPKTSSGKVQRYTCREMFENDSLMALSQEPTGAKTPITLRQAELRQAELTQRSKSSPKADALIDWLRDYATHHINSRLMDERRCIAPHVVLDFGNHGLLGMQVSSEYGGLGLGHCDTMRVLEQLGAIDPTLALFVGLNNVLGIRPIDRYGTQALRDELLPLLATGRELAAFALTESAAGANPQAITSMAVPNGQDWRLNGSKIWSGSAAWAGVINVFVQQQDQQGVSGFAVRRGTPGLRQGTEALTMGMRGMVQNTVHLEQVSVSRHELLGELGIGMSVAQDAMMYGRLAIASASLGGMKRCAQLILRYSRRRTVSTGRLLDNPAILARLSSLTAAITAVESLVKQVSQQLDAGILVPIEAYTACKTAAPEFYWQAADMLVQSLGGRGYIETNLAPQILRDARVLRIFEGPTETLNLFLGSRVIHQPQVLQTWLSQDLDSPEIAKYLFVAADQIREQPSRFADSIAADRWAALQIGELATLAILWAALEADQSKSDQIQPAIIWIHQQFEQKLEQVLSESSQSAPTVNMLENYVSNYARTIGEVEQRLAGEDDQLDDLLKQETQSQAVRPIKQEQVEHYLEDWGEVEIGQILDRSNSASKDSQDNSKLQSSISIQTWLVNWLSQKLKVSVSSIDRRKAFADYGIDSVVAVELAQDLETWLSLPQPLEATIAWNFPTIEALANYLAQPQVAPIPSITAPPENSDLSDGELAQLLTAEIAASRRLRR